MKILIISEYLHPQTSGIAVRLEYYIRYLRQTTHHVNVYGPYKCPTANRKLFSTPFYLINSDIRLCFPSFELYFDILFGKYDMVHIVGPNIFLCTILLFLLCKLVGINVCTSYHTNTLEFGKQYLKNPVCRRLGEWWCIYYHYYPTIWLKVPILHPENFTDLKVGCNNYNEGHILSTGVDTKLFQYSAKFIKNKLIYVGRIAPEKNLFRLLDLFTLIQDEYTLDIVGFGPSETELKDYVNKNKIHNIRFIGRVNYEKLYQYYQKAEAFVCTSLDESYGFTLLESMSCGTPIIYPKCTAFDKIYKPYFPQLEYHIQDDQEFLNVLTYIRHNGEELRRSCRTHIDQYSWTKSTDDLVSIYKSIITEYKKYS